MTQVKIEGPILNSAGQPLTGRLRVTLDSTLVDTSVIPHAIHTTEPENIDVIDGNISLSLKESQSSYTTYHFQFFLIETRPEYWLEEGATYTGPVNLHEGNYYTGNYYTTNSSLLFKTEVETEKNIIDFHAAVPPVASVYFSDLAPTGISSDVLDTSIARLARYFATDTTIAAQIVAATANAANIGSTPTGDVAASNVQAAVAELAVDKAAVLNNLSDLTDAIAARANLGLGSAAVEDVTIFAEAVHSHNGSNEVYWDTEPQGSNQLILTNAPNTISGYPQKWMRITLGGDTYILPAWKKL